MGEMATSIAHEVNQPLFAIVSNAEMAKEFLDSERPDIEEVRDALTDIIGDGNRAARIVRHVRSLVNKEQPLAARLDLNQVVLDSLEIIRPEMRRRGLSIGSELAEDLPPVNGSQIGLQQVILNLLINGAQAMLDTSESPRELMLTTSAHDGFVELSVKDHGVGLDQETMDRCFDPFFTTKPQGMGMGLAINRTIIEAHGGSIWATPNEDQGATFRFQLPVLAESAI
jgi:C4-dicarboxylate-specific signal transduction histidine kinase